MILFIFLTYFCYCIKLLVCLLRMYSVSCIQLMKTLLCVLTFELLCRSSIPMDSCFCNRLMVWVWYGFCISLLYVNKLFFFQAVREQLVQLMFETFNISGFYSSEQAVLSLYAVGRISGCTVDIGHGKIGMCTNVSCLMTFFFLICWTLCMCTCLRLACYSEFWIW